jgi:hypothetical protein
VRANPHDKSEIAPEGHPGLAFSPSCLHLGRRRRWPAGQGAGLRRTTVQVWTHPEALGQDVSTLAERRGMVSTLHEPC